MKRLNLFSLLFCAVATVAFGQVTTASLAGLVLDRNGDPLVGATVLAVHGPSGTQYGTTTRDDGAFTIPNMRVGGPYYVETSYIGFKTERAENVYLTLGQKVNLDFGLESESLLIDEVVISANQSDVINRDRTGAETNITSDQLSRLPTITRSASDFTRLTPASDGNSFAGRNDQFNNFSLDGAIFNNPFGLDAATPGGQTEAQPISLDAIDQINVALAPFDVTQGGFTGAAVNAVTKSGTNTFTGTVFGFFRNDDLTGQKVGDIELVESGLNQLQYGLSVGGPIIKNKLFFFVNAEIDNREDLGTTWVPRGSSTAGNLSRVAFADMQAVADVLRNRFGYDSGLFDNYVHETNSTKGILKFDWAINQKHTLTATGNFLDANKDKPAHPSAIGRRGPDFTTLQMQNSGYEITNKIYSGIVELRSLFGNKLSNKIRVGYTSFVDSRNPFSEPFPVVNIDKDGIRYIVAGHEPFSIHNRLDQRVLQFTDNLNIYSGDHTFTVGTSFEKFSFDNSFNLNAYGGTFGPLPGASSVQAFVDSVNAGALDATVDAALALFERNGGDDGPEGPATIADPGWALAQVNIGQWAVYAQDEWQATDNIAVTFGVRMDLPLYFNTDELIQENINRQCCYAPEITWYDENGNGQQFDNTVLPDVTPLISPRLGFNWNVKGTGMTQVRGGTGFFSGRLPFVWIGNHVANPNWYFYNYTRTDFKFPQVWRSNLGIDHNIGSSGWIGTVDLIYTDDINAAMVRNYGLKAPSGTLQGVDNRPIYTAADHAVFEGFGFPIPVNAYVFTNTDIGHSFNASAQLRKDFGDADAHLMLGYNYLNAEDATSIEAEISSDAYDRNPAFGNVNQAVSSTSLYGMKHRIIGSFDKKWTYGRDDKMSTTFATFFQYALGGTTQNDNVADFRFSYTYAGDINNDGAPGSGLNDLIYIPTEDEIFNEMQFVSPTARLAFAQYVAQDEYLNSHRGQYAEKYAVLAPWYSQWDVRIVQDFAFNAGAKPNHVQVSLDILNFGNLLSSDWGVKELPNNTQPIGVTVDANGVPTYSFDANLQETFSNDLGLQSRWQAQVGLRYIF
ncbi:MAG TPA: TonB-dependent receptor [Saprospiraceae bacterium]|nr:TonB-dependent receptor [Saprospiraceae bacterium]